jgi:hypothetical protein
MMATASLTANAQEGVSATVIVPKGTLDTPPGSGVRDRYPTLAEAFNSFAVYADGERCGELSLVDPEQRDQAGNAVFELGRADQPSACGREGTLITFTNSFFHDPPVALHERFELVAGQEIVLDNFAPEAPSTDPATPGAPAAGAGLAADAPPRSWSANALGIGTILVLATVVLYVVAGRRRA